MNVLYFLIPLIVGSVTVLQGTLNRQMSESMGLGMALIVNSIIALIICLILYALVRWQPDWFPAMFNGQLSMDKLAWWMIFPGIFGFCIIAGIPWAISKLGAAKVFVAIVTAQMTVSMLWDTFADDKPFSWVRLVGVSMAVVGALIVALDKN